MFKGDGNANWFQGGLGKDTATGGGGRDLYDFNAVPTARQVATRDVITDFAHVADKIDLMGIDADTTVAGNQALKRPPRRHSQLMFVRALCMTPAGPR